MNFSYQTRATLARLRPPFARAGTLLTPYSTGNLAGIVVQLPSGEPAVAPGTGLVHRIAVSLPAWNLPVYQVVLDHGSSVFTTVGGLSNCAVQSGQNVQRGQLLGPLLNSSLFLAVTVGRSAVNPHDLNLHWQLQNGSQLPGQGGKIDAAPDLLPRDLSCGVLAVLNNGIRYFQNLLAPRPVLISVAFNGDGTKVGYAAAGCAVTDFWNVYTPENFSAALAPYSCYGYGLSFFSFSGPVLQPLLDYSGVVSGVCLERVAPLFSAAGSIPSFDDMLARYIGGYVGPVPYENCFKVRGLAAGTYRLYLYADVGTAPQATTFYASAAGGTPVMQTNTPGGPAAFTVNVNYVVYTISVPAGGVIVFKTLGYLSGLQVQRV